MVTEALKVELERLKEENERLHKIISKIEECLEGGD